MPRIPAWRSASLLLKRCEGLCAQPAISLSLTVCPGSKNLAGLCGFLEKKKKKKGILTLSVFCLEFVSICAFCSFGRGRL